MWRLGILIMSSLFIVTMQAQSNPADPTQSQPSQTDHKPAPSDTTPIHRKAAITEVVASEIVPRVVWDDPQQKLQRAAIVNAVTEHQLALRRDTEKLLLLAEELKQNVDKTGPNILSMDVIKKAQEIEKLAKSVKEKMKFAY